MPSPSFLRSRVRTMPRRRSPRLYGGDSVWNSIEGVVGGVPKVLVQQISFALFTSCAVTTPASGTLGLGKSLRDGHYLAGT